MDICGKVLWKTPRPAAREAGKGPTRLGGRDMGSLSEHAIGACSACTGDYEDRDRTAWPADGTGGGEEKPSSGEDEFH